MGPQNGEPLCPCQMRAKGVFKRDAEWILPAQEEQILGKVREEIVIGSLFDEEDDIFTAESNYEVIKEIYRKKKCTGNCEEC
jgi:hypothetical protein